MNPRDYLNRLQNELHGMPADEKEDLLDEISFHLAEMQSDPVTDQTGRRDLEKEMGDPSDLGRRLKNVHRPGHWLEYLLIVIPVILIQLIGAMMMVLMGPYNSGPSSSDQSMQLSIRISILIQVCLVLAGYRLYRRQGLPAVFLYWLSCVWLTVFSLCLREKRWDSWVVADQPLASGETVFWTLLLAAGLVGLSVLLWRIKDPLWFTFVSLPFLTALGNLSLSEVIISGVFPGGYSTWQIQVGWFSFSRIVSLIWPLFFLFPRSRIWRWAGLLVYVLPFSLTNIPACGQYPFLIVVCLLPALLVLVFGSLEIKSKAYLS